MTNKYEIASRIELKKMDGFIGRMSAKDQRELFGAYLFGRKQIKINARGQGCVSGSFKIAFGQDANHFRFSFEQITDAANNCENLPF
jgi:hypothetical protein